MKNKPYTCPRCGYKTIHKNDMKRHFYNKKRSCPSQEADIELTVEMKEHILMNRIYNVKAKKEEPLGQVIMNNNVVNYYIAGMDTFEKMNKYFSYNKIEHQSLSDTLEDKYKRRVKRLENDSCNVVFELKMDDPY